MVKLPLPEAQKRLIELTRRVGRLPEVPPTMAEELGQVAMALVAYVGHVEYQKRRLGEMLAELEQL